MKVFFAVTIGEFTGFFPVKQPVPISIRIIGVGVVPVAKAVPETGGFGDVGNAILICICWLDFF
ncbi:hypothetical protein EO92_18255 [Methanosarcina sp. 2.H.A.1B.4]|nr:hypothetical protein EO92_18255 [Methanosarcina sp. 2.H.A.1B.4]KKH45946.1 hypothetical protein EO93_06775 [Methanosarcina sp. 1.H.A.2.2]